MHSITSAVLAGVLLLAGCSGADAPERDPAPARKDVTPAMPSAVPSGRGAILSPLRLSVERATLAPRADCILRRGADALAILVAGDGLVLVDGERRHLAGVPSDADALGRGGSFTAGDVSLSIRLAPELGEGDVAGTTSTKPVRVEARQGARAEQFEAALVCSAGATSAATAEVATTADQPKLAVEGEGLRWFLPPNGSARPIPFGTPQADVLASLQRVRGPAGRGVNEDCGAGPVDYANWPDGLSVVFQRGKFVGWGLDGRAAGALSTADGVGPGTTRAELERAFATVSVRRTSLVRSSPQVNFTVCLTDRDRVRVSPTCGQVSAA